MIFRYNRRTVERFLGKKAQGSSSKRDARGKSKQLRDSETMPECNKASKPVLLSNKVVE